MINTTLKIDYKDINSYPLSHHENVIKYLSTINQGEELLDFFVDNTIYQIYTIEFVEELYSIINSIIGNIENPVILEVMCGDGKLSDNIHKYTGYKVIPTDDMTNGKWYCSREYGIQYPDSIIKMEAEWAVEHYKPDLVVMSWEPYGSVSSSNIVHEHNVPLIWIGDTDFCADPYRLWSLPHQKMNSKFSIARGRTMDKITERSDIYLFDI